MGDVAPELIAAIVLETSPFEYTAALGDRPCVGFANVQAGAGLRSVIGLVNPANSGVLAIIERIDFVSNAGAADLVIRQNDGNFAGINPNANLRDQRIAGSPVCAVESDVLHVVGGQVRAVINHLNPRLEATAQAGLWLLSPGTNIVMEPGADNQALEVSIWWREKQVDASELSLTG